MCFVWIWEQTAIISLYSINWLVCIREMEYVYCAVRTGSQCIIRVNGLFRVSIIAVILFSWETHSPKYSFSTELHWALYQSPGPSLCLKLRTCEQYFAHFQMPLIIWCREADKFLNWQTWWEKNHLERRMSRWENNIETDLNGIGCEGRNWLIWHL